MLLLPLTLVACLWAGFGEALLQNAVPRLSQVDLIHRVQMDQQGAFVLLWTPRQEDVLFEVQVRSHGYVGLGFSASGGMGGADIVIGWIDDQGIVHFSDRHASGNRTPVEDPSQDYSLLGGYRNSSHTVLRFSRPWVTCDQTHDLAITADTVRVIWAYDAQPPDPSKSTLNYHDHRGTKSLYLKEPKMMIPSKAHEGKTWDIRAPQVEFPPGQNTLYWCKLYKIPSLPWKHHITGYVPLISEENLQHVHHMLLYECALADSEFHLEKWVSEKGAQCYGRNMPISWNACGTAIIAWAIGSQGEMLPEHVGFPLGEKFGGTTYFLLEIHYDNPRLKEGIVDDSGLRLFLTDRPREFDAGVLTVGHRVGPAMIIPPNRDWKTTAHCTADCTQKTIPAEGIKVFSGILHAHLLGQAISLQQIRDGKELEPLLIDNKYDFNYQQARFLSRERVIKPGDHLITTCQFNATHRSKPTFGGFGTKDEMCLVFVAYYPRLRLGECHSRPDLAMLLDVFGIQDLYENDRIMRLFNTLTFDTSMINEVHEQKQLKAMSEVVRPGLDSDRFSLVDIFRIVNISKPEGLRGKSFYDIIMSDSTWQDEDLILRLQEAVNRHQYEPYCLYSGRKVVKGLPKKAKFPHFTPIKPDVEVCQENTNLNAVDSPIPIDHSRVVEEKFQAPVPVHTRNSQPMPQQMERDDAFSISTQNNALLLVLSLLLMLQLQIHYV